MAASSSTPFSWIANLARTIRNWGEFVKISHTVFALPFALASMVVAARETRGWPGWKVFGLILLAMFCARTCAMAFNRIVDRHFDRANPRTANRHLPSGQISLVTAWAICLAGGAGLIIASYHLNPLCLYLSPVALFAVCFYSLTKRFTDFTHIYLGIALALAPLGAWLAVHGSFDLFPRAEGVLLWKQSAFLPLILGLAVVFWLIGFDMIYAIQDYEFDRANGLHSLVVRWGVINSLRGAFLSHMVMWFLLLLFGFLCGFRVLYLLGMLVIILFLLFEHWLARRRGLNWINVAFFRLNALISMVFLFITAAEVVFPFFRFSR